MGKNDDKRRTEDCRTVFRRAKGGRIHKIAGVTRNEKFTDAVTTENKLWGHPAICAGYYRCPRRLVRRDIAPLCSEVHCTEFRVTHVARVARFQGGQCLNG